MPERDAVKASDLLQAIAALRTWVEERDYAGYDPYDALRSPLLKAATLGRKMPRIAALQALRRLPVNLRPLFLIPPGHNPKALGLFLWGYSRLARIGGDPDAACHIERLLDLLQQTLSPGTTGHGWGYNFDWQNRVFFIPRGTPTIVNSAFIGHALLDAWRFAGYRRALDLALPIADFMMSDLARIPGDKGFCFSYTPIDRYAVHNANVLGASLLVRLALETGRKEWLEAAHESMAYTVGCQREDGSWYYAQQEGSRWVDSFHTGFVLQALHTFIEYGQGDAWREAFERGTAFYCDRFFLPDGTPRYYSDRTWPIDIHSPAQALAFLPLLGDSRRELALRVARFMLDHMRDDRGFFYFRYHPWFTNKIPYMRWGQAWAFHGLTTLHLHSFPDGGVA